MARTTVALQKVLKNTAAQLTLVGVDLINGNQFQNDGNVVLYVKNADSVSRTVTVSSVACSHGRTGDVVQTIASGQAAVMGPFDPSLFNQSGGVGGYVNVDTNSGNPGVSIAARQF